MDAPRPILLHGSGGDHRAWAALAGRLEGAVALDLPGHGGGAPRARVDEIGEALVPALRDIDAPRALVGHSLGGAVALDLALRRPELVDGLVLVATGARLPVPDHARERLAADHRGECERLVAGGFRDTGSREARQALETLVALGPEVLAADYAACDALDLRARLREVRAPALVVHGDDDPLTPMWMGEELARGIPVAQMAVVPGARHMLMAEEAGTVSLLVAAYLARLELTLAGELDD